MSNFIFHYTDLDALLGIIGTSHDLVFWGSRYDCMNDPLDYLYSRNRYLPAMMKAAKELRDEESIPEEALMEIETEPYIVSFSKKRDDFLMWRMYNAKVSLILDKRYFEKPLPNKALIECEYVDDYDVDLKRAFLNVDKQISNCMNISADASRHATFIKHRSFEVEGEVRLATWDYYDNEGNGLNLVDCMPTDEDMVDGDIYTRTKENSQIVLYKKFHIDKNALVGVIIHAYTILEYESIKNKIRSILIKNSYRKDVYDNILNTEAYPFNI